MIRDHVFYVAEMHGLRSQEARQFRIVEKVSTIDGQRDRFTNHAFETLKEAQEFIASVKGNTNASSTET